MSFSSEVKEELSKLPNLANKDLVKYEFLGYLTTNNMVIEQEKQSKKLKFSTENEYNINRFSKLLNNLQCIKYEIQIIGKKFSITVLAPNFEEVTYQGKKIVLNQKQIKEQLEGREDLKKAFVRGGFLGGGSINNPKNNYHLEIDFSQPENANFILEILKDYEITFKQITKKQNYGIYAKDGEEISKLLAFIGANNSVLKFEEIRVYRDVRNNVNRKVNCETANLNRTVNSALEQIEAINYLKENGKFEELSEGLQEIAELRIEHPEASLAELGTMLKVPIGKSGVNHRLKKICQFRDTLQM